MRTRPGWLRLSEISPILLRSAGIAGIAAGIMVVVSSGIWRSEPRTSEARAPAAEIAIRDVTEEPVIAPAIEAEGGALVIDSVAAAGATAEPAPERFAAMAPPAAPGAAAEPPAPVIVLPEPAPLAALPAPDEAQPAEDPAIVVAEPQPAPAVETAALAPEPRRAEQHRAPRPDVDPEALARARLALAVAAEAETAETEPPVRETAMPAAAAPPAAAARPEPADSIPEPPALTAEPASAAPEVAAAVPTAEAEATEPDPAALARARQAVALAVAATEPQGAGAEPQVRPLPQEAASTEPATEGSSPFTEHAVECPRDWVAGDQAEAPPGCQTIAALIPSDIEAEAEAALVAAAEEHAATMPRVPRARPDPGPDPIREQRTRTARADSSWPAEPPPNCGSRHARWRFVDEARTQKEWYCR